MSQNEFHQLTHQSKEHLQATAERLNIKLMGNLDPCIFCSKAMMKQTKLTREVNDILCEPGTRIAIDITGCNKESIGKNSYAHIKIDYGSSYMFTTFLKKNLKP